MAGVWLCVRLNTDMDDHHNDSEAAIDAGLVRRARDGDNDAFVQLVRRHERSAQQLAAFICGSTTQAADVTQEAFLIVYTTLSKLRSDQAFRPWLMRITANTAKNLVRSAARRSGREQRLVSFALPPALTPEDQALSTAEAEELWQALGTLDHRERVVVALRYGAGLTEAETAAALHIPAGTVKSRTSRALNNLRATLGQARD